MSYNYLASVQAQYAQDNALFQGRGGICSRNPDGQTPPNFTPVYPSDTQFLPDGDIVVTGHKVQRPGANVCYYNAAVASAGEMARERDIRLRNAGQQPIVDSSTLNKNFQKDVTVSLIQFIDNDDTLIYGPGDRVASPDGAAFRIFTTDDGIIPYSPDRMAIRKLERELLELKQLDAAAITELERQGADASTVKQVSRQLATDPLQNQIVAGAIDKIIPTTQLASSGVAADLSLPSGVAGVPNVLSQEDEAKRLAQMAQAVIDGDASIYRMSDAKTVQEFQQATDYAFWSNPTNTPLFEIIPSENPLLADFYFRTPWLQTPDARQGKLPPVIYLSVTPKTKPKPELGWLAQNISWLGPIASIIPFVGPIVSLGLSLGAAAQAGDFKSQWHIEPNQFAPQYVPQTFKVPIPLDQAQFIVKNPRYGVAMILRFVQAVQSGDLALLNQLVQSGVTPPAQTINNGASTLVDPVDVQIASVVKNVDAGIGNGSIPITSDKITNPVNISPTSSLAKAIGIAQTVQPGLLQTGFSENSGNTNTNGTVSPTVLQSATPVAKNNTPLLIGGALIALLLISKK